MFRKKLLLAPLLCALLLPFSCGKTYEDGPCISFRSAKNRIIGTWKVDKFLIEDIDSTVVYNSLLGHKIEFSETAYGSHNSHYLFLVNNSNVFSSGTWEFPDGSKNQMRTYFSNDAPIAFGIGPFKADALSHWQIIKLTNKEFNITTYYNDFTLPLGTRKFQINLLKIKE